MADSGGNNSRGEQFCPQSVTECLRDQSGNLGLPTVRDNIRSFTSGPSETKVAQLKAVLGSGVSEAKIRALLVRFGNYPTLLAADSDELAVILGNRSRAAKLKSIMQIGAEFAQPTEIDHPVIRNCADLVRYLQIVIGGCRIETFRVLFLDTHNRIIADEQLWSGTVSEVQIYPREIIRRALELDSSALIAAHNHPSNFLAPSQADIDMTRKLIHAADMLGIALHDHFIVSASSYHSMRFHKSVDPWGSVGSHS
ncbi:JAB domain-containing protein [Sphingorhabdus profundilacus]|nr:DNA repair protein RadC [Sphingorhabdus profundilacus]